MKMPFGIHKDKDITEVPTPYLTWLETTSIEDWLRGIIVSELGRRKFEGQSITTKWPRDVCLEKLHSVLKMCPDDMFSKSYGLGEFSIRLERK